MVAHYSKNTTLRLQDVLACGTQDGVTLFVKEFLYENGIPYHQDSYKNIYYLSHRDAPLLDCHMDSVMELEDMVLLQQAPWDDDKPIFKTGGIIGGDDRCGVYLQLKLLKSYPGLNFIFSRNEEKGCLGIEHLLKSKENQEAIQENCLYALGLDAVGSDKIICYENSFGSWAFDRALSQVSDEDSLGYSSQAGGNSDVTYLKKYACCANISVGYHNQHTKNEFIDLEAVGRSEAFVGSVISRVRGRYKAMVYCE